MSDETGPRQRNDFLGREVTEFDHSESTRIIKIRGRPLGRRVWDKFAFPVGMMVGFTIAGVTGADLRPYLFKDQQDVQKQLETQPEGAFKNIEESLPNPFDPLTSQDNKIPIVRTQPTIRGEKHEQDPIHVGRGDVYQSPPRIRFPSRIEPDTLRNDSIDDGGWRSVKPQKKKRKN